jgi:hypothetical protein
MLIETGSRTKGTYSVDCPTHFFAHLLLGDFGVVESEVLPIHLEGTSFLVALQAATIRVIFQLETPIQKPVHVVWGGLP